jgi:hypothetical protein
VQGICISYIQPTEDYLSSASYNFTNQNLYVTQVDLIHMTQAWLISVAEAAQVTKLAHLPPIHASLLGHRLNGEPAINLSA